MAIKFSVQCQQALRLLAQSKNVLVSGPPGTGKSRLLSEVALAFVSGFTLPTGGGAPLHDALGKVPIPPAPKPVPPTDGFPAPDRLKRQVFRTVFHQNSKHRDFLTGITPSVFRKAGEPDFRIIQGTLFRASEHAKASDSASLLIIDEVNRGPAVQIFGGAIVAIEADKRLAENGSKRAETQYFEILDPMTGDVVEYALPPHLYILAAMNQADASVEPLDVAFLRRWEPLRLLPDYQVLRQYFGLPDNVDPLPEQPAEPKHVYEAACRALHVLNDQISLGRGSEFQVGHGVLMSSPNPGSLGLAEAKAYIASCWGRIRAHVEEVFFGDARGVAATLNALEGPSYNPYRLTETTFADDLRFRLEGPQTLTATDIYAALRAIGAPRAS